MKVELVSITNQKPNILNRIKHFFIAKLKPLNIDTFEKNTAEHIEKHEILSRKTPNWCDDSNTQYRNHTIAKRILYYPEDIKKMEKMSNKEMLEYKSYLDSIGRYYYDENFKVNTPELDKISKEYGINIDDFIIKDK